MKVKRKRGGQQGNQNARKHGFYSVNMSPREICEFWNFVNLDGVEPALAVLRMKLTAAIGCDPGNRRVLREAFRLLVKWYRSKYKLDRKENAEFKKYIRHILKAAGDTSGSLCRNES
jgi:hypothetical protein